MLESFLFRVYLQTFLLGSEIFFTKNLPLSCVATFIKQTFCCQS